MMIFVRQYCKFVMLTVNRSSCDVFQHPLLGRTRPLDYNMPTVDEVSACLCAEF